MSAAKDGVFKVAKIGTEYWQARLNGAVLPATWPDKGSAQAGLEVERQRAAAKACPSEEYYREGCGHRWTGTDKLRHVCRYELTADGTHVCPCGQRCAAKAAEELVTSTWLDRKGGGA